MLTKAEQAKADRALQSIASIEKDGDGSLLAWLRNGFESGVFLLEDINGGKNSSVGATIRKWLKVRHEMPVEQRSISAFSSPGEIVRFMPADNGVMISNRQDMLFDRQKGQFESWSHTFPSGMTLTIPLSMFGAVSNSIGTTWCTGAMKYNRFADYAEDSPLLIMRLPNGKVYQATFNLEPEEFSHLILMNGGDPGEYIEEALEHFIENGLTVKNSTDEDMSEADYNEFMRFFADVIPMMGKTIVAGLKDEWRVQLSNAEVDRDEDLPVLDEETVCEHLQNFVPFIVAPETSLNDSLVTVPDAGNYKPAEPKYPDGAADDLLSAMERGSFVDAILELRVILSRSKEPERVDAVLQEFGQKVSRSFLFEILDGMNSSSDFMTKNGSVLALFKALGPDRFSAFMSDAWDDKHDRRKAANLIMFTMCDPELSAAYPKFLETMSKDISDPNQLNVLDFASHRVEMADVEDIAGLSERVLSLPWMNKTDRDAIRLGYLVDAIDRVREECPMTLEDILNTVSEYSVFSEGMKQYPDGVLHVLLPGHGKISEKDYVSFVSRMFEIKERNHFDDFNDWSDGYDVIASALVSKFESIDFKDSNIRLACLAALSSMDRSAVKLATREQRWIFDAFAFRHVETDDYSCDDPRLVTNSVRRFGLYDNHGAAFFLRENGIVDNLSGLLSKSQLSSLVQHHDSKTVALIEKISAGVAADPAHRLLTQGIPKDLLPAFTELTDVGKRQIEAGMEGFRAASAAFSKFRGDESFEASTLSGALDDSVACIETQRRNFNFFVDNVKEASIGKEEKVEHQNVAQATQMQKSSPSLSM